MQPPPVVVEELIPFNSKAVSQALMTIAIPETKRQVAQLISQLVQEAVTDSSCIVKFPSKTIPASAETLGKVLKTFSEFETSDD